MTVPSRKLGDPSQDPADHEREPGSWTAHHLGPVAAEVDATVDELVDRDAVRRLWDRDHTLWQDDPDEVVDRLGWLDSPSDMQEHTGKLRDEARRAADDGLTDVLVVGMGGSSLFPLVVSEVFPTDPEALRLHVLDSVDPDAVARVSRDLPLDSTLVVAASKSGTTAETRSLLAHFWQRSGDPERFAVITDPGTDLAELARERGFRAVFENRPDIGGRYSALSHFGLVPAGLAGVDVDALLERATEMAADCTGSVDPGDNSGLRLAGILAGAARTGRDKLTIVADDRLSPFGLWIEQLIAESTGKRGTGIVPVVGEPLGDPAVYGDDRLFVGIGIDPDALADLADAGHPVVTLAVDEPVDLGGEVVRWEIATALTGAVLGINPFDQPNVEAAKNAARAALDRGVPEVEIEPVTPLLGQLQSGDYLAIQAYVDPAASVVEDLERVRVVLRDRFRVATTLGIGPRYLHSTGQLHKGGPDSGVFVQVVADHDPETPIQDPQIPGESFGFATLMRAQAAGDLRALRDRERRAARVTFTDLSGTAVPSQTQSVPEP